MKLMRYWIINVRDADTVSKIMNLNSFNFKDIYNFSDKIQNGDRVWFHFGGDTQKSDVTWSVGIAGFGYVEKGPHNFYNEKYYNLEIKPEVVFPVPCLMN